jgi:hypothetical protein
MGTSVPKIICACAPTAPHGRFELQLVAAEAVGVAHEAVRVQAAAAGVMLACKLPAVRSQVQPA